jgi:hypothetical protein
MKTKNGFIYFSFDFDQIQKLHHLHRIMARGSTSSRHMQHNKLTTLLILMIK